MKLPNPSAPPEYKFRRSCYPSPALALTVGYGVQEREGSRCRDLIDRVAGQSHPVVGASHLCRPQHGRVLSGGRAAAGVRWKLYGTTVVCGIYNTGIAYKMTLAGVETVIHDFTGTGVGEDGNQPRGTLVQGSDETEM
jgi:hypothetical protein